MTQMQIMAHAITKYENKTTEDKNKNIAVVVDVGVIWSRGTNVLAL